ncbi:MAG: MnhB domain-containing protein [Desulfurococcaceae archaeon]
MSAVKARALGLALLLAAALLLSLALAQRLSAPKDIKPLGLFYVENTLAGNYSARSPEAVTAIVWDYRGIDTLYETAVFYLAVVGGLAIFRLPDGLPRVAGIGMTKIARTSTKLLAIMIASVSASIALHGHLTPGGGFQGGSAMAVAPFLLVPVFSVYELMARGISATRLVIARGLALSFIGLTAALPLVRGLAFMNNQPFYPYEVFGQLTSGSLVLYNAFEYVAVASGFAAVVLYMSIGEEHYIGRVRRGEDLGAR